MEKKIWSTPVANVEQFLADEYVNACWGIECWVPNTEDPFTGADNDDPWGTGGYDGHHRDGEGHCGDLESQYIRDVGNGKYEIVEIYEGRTPLQAQIYQGTVTDNFFNADNPPADNMWSNTVSIQDGYNGYLVWKTEIYSHTYYHYGKVDFVGNRDSANHS